MLTAVRATLTVILVGYRWLLCYKFYNLKDIAASLDKREGKRTKPARWIYCLIFISIFFQVLAVLYASLFPAFGTRILYGIKLTSLSAIVYIIIHKIQSAVLYMLPITTFSIFYVSICTQIRSELVSFQNLLSTKTILNYEGSLKAFSCIKTRVEAIDKEVSFLIFCSIVHTSSTMYYLLHVAFDPDYNKSSKLIEIILSFLFNSAIFFVSTVSASMVGETSQEIASTVRSLTAPSVATGVSLQRFLFVVEKDICLTVWKIVPIRRNFIIGTMGAILTYSALFHGLNV
ncbi:uncharacterized protein TNCT_220201 [Trichonephila clavata]|uniref:Uncharacterized protein n=1 Tax=Trichonephila clavata TaxID=2740835 RepID=A0A8X6F659_TRICU|nr:uncharacterized protein TNCT_220201 [Trichonephila clavata]